MAVTELSDAALAAYLIQAKREVTERGRSRPAALIAHCDGVAHATNALGDTLPAFNSWIVRRRRRSKKTGAACQQDDARHWDRDVLKEATFDRWDLKSDKTAHAATIAG